VPARSGIIHLNFNNFFHDRNGKIFGIEIKK
jgi:hypothetical protein